MTFFFVSDCKFFLLTVNRHFLAGEIHKRKKGRKKERKKEEKKKKEKREKEKT